MGFGLLRRRINFWEKGPDIYEGCVTLEFTETTNNVRTLTNHVNAPIYLEKIMVDGLEYEPKKVFQMQFDIGEHKIGWKVIDNIIRTGVIANASPSSAFAVDNALVTIPANIVSIEGTGMRGFPAYRPTRGVICYAKTPPVTDNIAISLWYLVQQNSHLYVPAESVEAYKVAEGWSYYASQIVAIGT